jgi:muconolactone delta-isomerase
MKILALESDVPGSAHPAADYLLQEEARRVWEFQQAGTLREIYFREDSPQAVLILEVASHGEARAMIESLPLVKAGLTRFEIIPLRPYPGLARLFAR